jgi:hypothetical protein
MDNLTEKPVHVIDDTDERLLSANNPQAELLRWHYRLGHISFARLRILALLGTIPRKLIHAKTPKCAGCMYGAMTKRPWRTKAQQNKSKIKSVTRPGDCVSIDQLESPTPGFVAQLKGALTKKRYRAATVFVDHASRLSYIHLQQGLTSEETVEAKRAFEAYARSHGVSIKHYHADNGRFADNAFIDSIARSGQTISYCGVNAHFQNGVAEKRIRDLQEQARKQLLHAKSRWPSAIEINLWPYALRTANDIRNTIPDKEDGSSPLERFCRTNVSPKLRHNHTFGCPVYALDNRLQANSRIPKWNPRARLGINLGSSPRHASSVTLFTMAVHSRSQAASTTEPIHTFRGSQRPIRSRSIDTTKPSTTRRLRPTRQLIATRARFTRTMRHRNEYTSISRTTCRTVCTIVRTSTQRKSIRSHSQASK